MKLTWLTTSRERSRGATFSKGLQDEILIFPYPTAARRLFYTFFCPPLRIVAFNGPEEIAYDRIVQPGRFVSLPACDLVLEMAPNEIYHPYLAEIWAAKKELPQTGAIAPGVDLGRLLFALVADAVADMRRIREAHGYEALQPDVQQQRFALWERGQIVGSAGFLLDFSDQYHLPSGAVNLSHAVLAAESPFLDELVAASVAGRPWRHEFPNDCMRCGKPGSWRAVLQPPVDAPHEVTWRYERPENAVVLCHHCVETLEFLRKEDLRIDLVWGLWGPRFEALWRWHRALEEKTLPHWDTYPYPLWPAEFGGKSWETGSGSLAFPEPRPPHGVQRSKEHEDALLRAIHSKRMRGRQPGETPLERLLDFQLKICDGDLR